MNNFYPVKKLRFGTLTFLVLCLSLGWNAHAQSGSPFGEISENDFSKDAQQRINKIEKKIRDLKSGFILGNDVLSEIEIVLRDYDDEVVAATNFYSSCEKARVKYSTYGNDPLLSKKYSSVIQVCDQMKPEYKAVLIEDQAEIDELRLKFSTAKKYTEDNSVFLDILVSQKEFEIRRAKAKVRRGRLSRALPD